MAREQKASKQQAPPNFEESLASLEAAVQQLEHGKLGLDDSLACYEQGVKHLRHCYKILDEAERKIELLVSVDKNGRPRTQDFDDEELSLDEKATARGQRRGIKRQPAEEPHTEEPPNSLF